jgi:hypothetical protein
MKTAEYYSKIYLMCLPVELTCAVLAWTLPDPWWYAGVAGAAVTAAVCIWAVIKESQAKKS